MASRLIESGNEVLILWVPAHAGIEGNEAADSMAKEAAAGQSHDVPDQVRWQASLPHLSRSHGATIRDHGPVDQGPRQAGASLRPPWRPRLPEEGDAEDTQIHHPAILPVDVQPYGSRLLLAQDRKSVV